MSAKVVLPDPLSPVMPMMSPLSISIFTFSIVNLVLLGCLKYKFSIFILFSNEIDFEVDCN